MGSVNKLFWERVLTLKALSNFWLVFHKRIKRYPESIYIGTVSSQYLLPALLIWFKMIYALFGKNNINCWKIEVILLWNNLSFKERVTAQFINQCTHMWLHWLLLGTCDYIDCNIEVNTRLSSKSQCTHMWLHWVLLSYMRKLNF